MAKELNDRRGGLEKVRAMLAAPDTRLRLGQLIPEHVKLDRILRIAFAAYQLPHLADCDPQSVLRAIMDCCRLGLEPDGVEGAFVPYSGQVQFQPMYRGLIALARRSGEVTGVQAFVVYERDRCTIKLGSSPSVEHEMHLGGDRGKPIAVYSVITLKGGESQIDAMTWPDVIKVRDRSRGYQQKPNASPWTTDPEEMGKKTVVKRGLKYAPRSIELARALEHEAAIEQDRDSMLPALELDAPTEPRIEQAEGQTATGVEGRAVQQVIPPPAKASQAPPKGRKVSDEERAALEADAKRTPPPREPGDDTEEL